MKNTQTKNRPKLDRKQRASDFYTCNYEWEGGGDWFYDMQRQDNAHIKRLQKKVRGIASGDSVKEALDREINAWKAVTKTFDKMVEGQGYLAFGAGQGSVSMEEAKWASVLLRYYRCACLEEDYLSIKDSCKTKVTEINTSKLFHYMSKRVNRLDVNEIEKDVLNDRRGDVAQYKRELAVCKREVKKVESAFNKWIEARKIVSSYLFTNVGVAYLRDTQKVINSLVKENF